MPPPSVDVKGVEFAIGDNPVIGSDSAKLIMLEFTDYQCPFCGRYSRETFPSIKEHYIDLGIIRYVVIDQPLPIHPDALKAAEAARCAGDQGKFWEMHEVMMLNQDGLKDLSSYAFALKLDVLQFDACLSSAKYVDSVRKDIELAVDLGMTGVPGFIIGTVDAGDPRKIRGISSMRGALPFLAFQQEISSALDNVP
jgi:protein-disulfide isomerase